MYENILEVTVEYADDPECDQQYLASASDLVQKFGNMPLKELFTHPDFSRLEWVIDLEHITIRWFETIDRKE